MTHRFSAVAVFLLTVLPAAVSAQEHETALSPFSGDVGNALWTVVIFVLVVLVLGKYAWGKIVGVSVGTMVAFFLMFEIWFRVPLPKGALETALGFN